MGWNEMQCLKNFTSTGFCRRERYTTPESGTQHGSWNAAGGGGWGWQRPVGQDRCPVPCLVCGIGVIRDRQCRGWGGGGGRRVLLSGRECNACPTAEPQAQHPPPLVIHSCQSSVSATELRTAPAVGHRLPLVTVRGPVADDSFPQKAK